ncbi:FAD/NAD(P)-binding domain-containing protein, partial [Aureobasidium melanogenum]
MLPLIHVGSTSMSSKSTNLSQRLLNVIRCWVHELVVNTRIHNNSAVFTNDHAEHTLLLNEFTTGRISHNFILWHQEAVSTVAAVEWTRNISAWRPLVLPVAGLTWTPSAPSRTSPDTFSPLSSVTSDFSGSTKATLLASLSVAGLPLPSCPIALSLKAVCKSTWKSAFPDSAWYCAIRLHSFAPTFSISTPKRLSKPFALGAIWIAAPVSLLNRDDSRRVTSSYFTTTYQTADACSHNQDVECHYENWTSFLARFGLWMLRKEDK